MNYDAHALWSESVRIRDLTLNEAQVLQSLWPDQVEPSGASSIQWRGLEHRSCLVAAGAWSRDNAGYVVHSFITSSGCPPEYLRRFTRDLCWRLPVYQGAESARATLPIPLYSGQSGRFSKEQRIWDKNDCSLFRMLAELGWRQASDGPADTVNMRWLRRF